HFRRGAEQGNRQEHGLRGAHERRAAGWHQDPAASPALGRLWPPLRLRSLALLRPLWPRPLLLVVRCEPPADAARPKNASRWAMFGLTMFWPTMFWPTMFWPIMFWPSRVAMACLLARRDDHALSLSQCWRVRGVRGHCRRCGCDRGGGWLRP